MIFMPGMIIGWLEAEVGPEVLEGIPVKLILQCSGILAALYSCVYKIGYDLLANRYTLTDEEVTEVYGLIMKDTRVTKLIHIRRVSVEIGIMGRIFGYGDVLYYTAGSGGVDVRLKDIPNPEALAKEADNLAKKKQGGDREAEAQSEVRASQLLGAGSSSDHQILAAFSESVTESVAVQKQMLAAIQGLRSETRRNASLLSAALKSGAVGASESDPDPDDYAESFVASRSADMPEEPEDVSDSDYGELPESGEEDHHSASPKMFDAPEDSQAEPEAISSDSDLSATPEFDLESEPDREEFQSGEFSSEESETPDESKPDEFFGLIAPGKK
ncbi:PH domain-containing protein [Marinobacter sp. LV10MA510-1]|uniref:PH domain-containing protein n=1 Tax=Marinobacter sp. LV10MA510-1 TaxID=1415567 RepID=UPI000BF50AB7|nr:PH domain-containing protein [Marinobacter sp. LV10MA510-1]PFG08853.1 PH (Pleckstrin Homology) domain-containing protein [Marinobacter sp. LV10MA510-1]